MSAFLVWHSLSLLGLHPGLNYLISELEVDKSWLRLAGYFVVVVVDFGQKFRVISSLESVLNLCDRYILIHISKWYVVQVSTSMLC